MLKRTLLVIALILAVPTIAAPADFVAGTVDLPLMPGLQGAADDPVVFDSPVGRIVESWASGAVAEDAVRQFYAETLPQLGWRPSDDGTYRRDSEVLTIETKPGSDGVAVRFQIAPGGAGEG